MRNLGQPNKRISDAVDVRSELDLRIGTELIMRSSYLKRNISWSFDFYSAGASFTRFQTLRLKRVFPEILGDSLISYGSCQFPTMGFVVERYKAAQNFIPEPFWKIRGLRLFFLVQLLGLTRLLIEDIMR